MTGQISIMSVLKRFVSLRSMCCFLPSASSIHSDAEPRKLWTVQSPSCVGRMGRGFHIRKREKRKKWSLGGDGYWWELNQEAENSVKLNLCNTCRALFFYYYYYYSIILSPFFHFVLSPSTSFLTTLLFLNTKYGQIIRTSIFGFLVYFICIFVFFLFSLCRLQDADDALQFEQKMVLPCRRLDE